MTHGINTYPLKAPKWLWDLYKQSTNGDVTLDEPIIEYVAEHVLEEHDDLGPDQRQQVRTLLEGDDGL